MFDRAILRYFGFCQEVGAVTPTERGVAVSLGSDAPGTERLQIDAIRPDIVRLAISRQGHLASRPTPAVSASLPAPPPFDVSATDAAVSLATTQIRIQIDRAGCHIEASRPGGSRLFRTARDTNADSLGYGTMNDEFILVRERGREDMILGLGQKGGDFNRNGRSFLLWNTDVLGMDNPQVVKHWPFDAGRLKKPSDIAFDPYYMSIPFFSCLDAETGEASGHFIDNSYPAYFDFSQDGRYHIHFAGGGYVEYVFAGPALKDIIEGFSWLTGRIQPPPLWALGHHQCRWHLYDETRVRTIAATYRAKKIPCDSLWLDIDYMDGFRVFTWARDRFPKPEAMISSLREGGFRLVTIIDPGVKIEPGYPVYDEGADRGLFCLTEGGAIYTGQVWPGRTAFPDFVKAETRQWWAGRIAALADEGVAGIWIDMNEPSTGEIDPLPMRFDGGRVAHARDHNLYALLMAEATVSGLQIARPDERTFVLSRAGSAGIQRSAANWLGDNFARWDHLWLSMPMTMGLGMSGQPFVGADVGGFAEPATGEILSRWYQMAALSPFLRNHNCDEVDQYPWSFGGTWEEICRQAICLRYRLMPYIYAAFLDAARTGAPVQRPLLFEFQSDRATWTVSDQYLLGAHLLVAPVIEAMARKRRVYLPAGTWHEWHTGLTAKGPRTLSAEAPPERIPLFVRGGAVIPQWPEAPPTTMDYHPEAIELVVFVPEEDGETVSRLEEDDGLTRGRANGAFYRTRFTLTRAGNRLTLSADVSGDGYPQFRRRQFRIAFRGAAMDEVRIGRRPLDRHNGAFVLDNRGENFTLTCSVSPSRSTG
jgi:alpha-glucosidase